MPINFDLTKYTNNNIFIETGTYDGKGIEQALESGFKQVYSIEIDEQRYETCRAKYKQYPNVAIMHGDSGEQLPLLLLTIDQPVTFFLDAHYCADGGEIGDKWCPLKEELNAIKEHHIKNHTILIDDWRCMENTHVDYTWKTQNPPGSCYSVDDNHGKEVGFLGKENCFNMLREINKDYVFTFENGSVENDVLCCTIETS